MAFFAPHSLAFVLQEIITRNVAIDKYLHVICVFFIAAASTHDYYMKVVPTVYETSYGTQYYPYQYTFAQRVSCI